MANVANKGKIIYDYANEWPRLERLLSIQPNPAQYSYTGIIQASHSLHAVTLEGMFHWHGSGNDRQSQAFEDFVHKNANAEIDTWTKNKMKGKIGHLVTFKVIFKPTVTFNSYQVTNLVLDAMRLWFKIVE